MRLPFPLRPLRRFPAERPEENAAERGNFPEVPLFLRGGGGRKALHRMIAEQRGQNEQRRHAQADGVGGHDCLEGAALRKHQIDPRNADAAHPAHRKQSRNQRNPEAAQISGHHLVEQAERVGQHDHHQADVPDFHDLRVAVEDRQQRLSEQQNDCDRDCKRNAALQQAQPQRPPAALQFVRAVVLADKGGAGLREGVEYVVGDNLDIERRAGRRHHDRPETVDCGLDYDVGDGEYGALQSGGQPDFQDAPQDARVDPQQLRLQTDGLGASRKAAPR